MPVKADDDYFPVFHLRPKQGHINDPNAPFRDPATGYYHLFTQYRLRSNESIGWFHYISKDLARWALLGQALKPDGTTSCPDIDGCFTGSATIGDGVPRARSHCRFVPPLIHFIKDSLTYSVIYL
jgi:sucrose-6-phosphate hydrolase SacC (GH32 family)